MCFITAKLRTKRNLQCRKAQHDLVVKWTSSGLAIINERNTENLQSPLICLRMKVVRLLMCDYRRAEFAVWNQLWSLLDGSALFKEPLTCHGGVGRAAVGLVFPGFAVFLSITKPFDRDAEMIQTLELILGAVAFTAPLKNAQFVPHNSFMLYQHKSIKLT